MRQFWECLGISAGLFVAGFTIHSYLEGIPLLWECFLYGILVLLAVGIYWSLRRKHRPRKGGFMVTSGARRTESGLGFPGPIDYVDGLPKSPDRKKRELFNRARSQQEKDHHKAAIDLFKECLDMPNSLKEEATLQLQIGNSFFDLGDVGHALPAYQAALSKARQVEDSQLEGASLGNMGNVYAQKGELDKALTHYKQALEIDRKIDSPLGEAKALGNIGNIYAQKGELDKALTHYKQALEIDRRIDNPLGEAQDLGNLGLVLLEKGLDEEAKPALESSYGLYMELEAEPAEMIKVKEALDSLKNMS